MRRVLASVDETLALGAELAGRVGDADVVFLRGPLGAGKTTLVRGMLRALGHTGPVTSPTFTLVEAYTLSPRVLYHFDLYRLESPDELESIGIRDYLGEGICVIEWPERGCGFLPRPDWEVTLGLRPGEVSDRPHERTVEIVRTPRGASPEAG